MSDIVERLRERAASGVNCLCGNPVCDEAAEEILRLRAENEKLRAALKPFADWIEYVDKDTENARRDCDVVVSTGDSHLNYWLLYSHLRAAAAALKETDNG